MKHAHNHLAGVLPPFLACWAFAVYWVVFGWGPLDRAELPLARLIHSAAGWSDFIDWQIIFFNRWWGEAVCVVLIYAAFLVVARQASGTTEDHRRVHGFSAVILLNWVLANFVGEDLIEPMVARNSPSYLLGEHFTDLAELHQCKVKVRSSNSFPSNHGTVFMLVFVISVYRYGWRAWVLFPVALVLSLPRCFTGAHWVSDSLIGSLLMTWLISAVVMTTPLRRLADRIEGLAVRIFPPWLAGSGREQADSAAPPPGQSNGRA